MTAWVSMPERRAVGEWVENARVRRAAYAVAGALVMHFLFPPLELPFARRTGYRAFAVIGLVLTSAYLCLHLRASLRPGDDVLVKGSLAMGMSAIVRGIRAEGEG